MVLLMAFFCVGSSAAGRIPVVLSTDVGNEIDDQWAIVYLLTNPQLEALGLMSAHAPTIAPPAGHTSCVILRDIVERRLGMTVHPPIFEGASEPLQDARTPRPSEAADFLIRVSRGFGPENRLTVFILGAATDVASAILSEPGITQRIRIIQMGYNDWPNGGDVFNIVNDVRAAQILLDSDAPLVIGSADVCRRYLDISFSQAHEMLAHRGPIGSWLLAEYQAWYYRFVKPTRRNDFSKPWVIWDIITLAHSVGLTTATAMPRPKLRDDLSFELVKTDRTITWITEVNRDKLWADFLEKVDMYSRTHLVPEAAPPRLTCLLP